MKVQLTALLASRWHRAETHTVSTFMARVYSFYGRQTRHSLGRLSLVCDLSGLIHT